MLTVKTFIADSKLHGIGLFAGENIPKGTLVWNFNPQFDLEIKTENLSYAEAKYLQHYGYLVKSGGYVLCGDNAKFMNHSNKPNVSSADDMNYALFDIAYGEEILCDYREFDMHFKERNLCL